MENVFQQQQHFLRNFWFDLDAQVFWCAYIWNHIPNMYLDLLGVDIWENLFKMQVTLYLSDLLHVDSV